MQTGNRYCKSAPEIFSFFILLLVCVIFFTGCAHPLKLGGIRKLNKIQISPSRMTHDRQRLNVTVNLNTRVNSQIPGYDLVLQEKLESSLISSLKNLNIFESVQANTGEIADLELSVNFSFHHSAFGDLQYLPVAILTLFLITPSHVETLGSTEVSINASSTNFSGRKVFTVHGIGRTLTGIAGQGDAAAKAIEDVSTKLISKITEFTASKYHVFKQIDLAKRSQYPEKKKPSIIAGLSDEGDLPSTTKGVPKDLDIGKYHALVIGNNDYERLPKLQTAINDAKAVARVLRDLYDFRIKIILNGKRYDILSTLDKLRSELTPKDNLLIYYAGHGYFDEDADRGYWLPVDASDDTSADWISNADITDKLKALRAKHVMVVADTCYSGTLTRGVKAKLRNSEYLLRISRKRARTVLTSGGLEPVVDRGRGGHSVFAKALLTVLRENTEIMDGTQLFIKIRRPVMVNAPQTPQYSDIRFAGHEGGDFLFVPRR